MALTDRDAPDPARAQQPERSHTSTALIIETITTTTNEDGTVNCAAMGVEWGDERIVIKPYRGTRTLRNLRARPHAVVNLVDDILLFVRSALGDPHPATRPATVVQGAVLEAACSWREVRVEAIDGTDSRAHVTTRIVARGMDHEFLGLNRARNAVLEASILATRTRRLPHDEIRADLRRLQLLVDKTGGEKEHAAMRLVVAHCDARLGRR